MPPRPAEIASSASTAETISGVRLTLLMDVIVLVMVVPPLLAFVPPASMPRRHEQCGTNNLWVANTILGIATVFGV
jgi:hypothetical protein